MENQKTKTPHVEVCGEKWTISFAPVVSGIHTVTVDSEIQFGKYCVTKQKHSTIKIIGKPRNKERVCRGPDWNSTEEQKNDIGENEGTIIDTGDEQSKEVKVRWNDNKETIHKWGEDGKYEVQIAEIKEILI